MNKCKYPNCDKPVVAKKYCMTHYRRLLRNGTLKLKILHSSGKCQRCGKEGDNIHWRRGLCDNCYYKEYVRENDEYYKFSRKDNKNYTDLSKKKKHEYVINFLEKNNTFPYPVYNTDQLNKEWEHLKQFDDYNIEGDIFYLSSVGLKIPTYYHPEIFDVVVDSSTMVDLFNDKEELYKVVYRGLGKDYSHTSNGLLSMMKNWHGKQYAHHFRPVLAKWFAENYCKERLLDYSAGFGSRLIGTLAAGKSYIGIDPNIITQSNNEKIKEMLSGKYTGVCHLLVGQSEIEMKEMPKEYVDCIFSCPPYFDKEIYSSDKTQSVFNYPNYEIWKELFLEEIVRESKRILNGNGYFGMVISNVNQYLLAEDTMKILQKYFTDIKEMKIAGNLRATSGKNENKKFKYESLFIAR